MATISAGLRADVMRSMMEDKNTLTVKGALYVGAGTTTTVGGVTIYNTQALNPGSADTVLCSNGTSAIPSYKKLTADNLAADAITNAKIADGAITNAKIDSISISKIDGVNMTLDSDGTLTIVWNQ